MNKLLRHFNYTFINKGRKQLGGGYIESRHLMYQQFNKKKLLDHQYSVWDFVRVLNWQPGHEGYDGKKVVKLHLSGASIHPVTKDFGMTEWVVDD